MMSESGVGLKRDEGFWRGIVENLLAAVFIVGEDLRYKYVNKIVESFTGYSREEIYDMDKVTDLAYEEDIPYILEAIKQAFGGKRVFMENRYVTKDGKIRWVWGFLTPVEHEGKKFVLGNWIDVTRIKKLEQKLKESEIFYRTLIEDSLAPVYIVQKGRFVYVNKAFEKLTGFSKEELMKINPFDFVYPEDRDLVYRRYVEREKGLRGTETYSWRIITKEGDIRWVTVRPSRILYKGEPAVAATLVDTTEIHRLNEKLERKNKYLALLNKIIRHDILNDLAVVRAALELRDEGLMDKALARIDKIVRLIEETRVLEKVGDKIKVVNLADIVKEVAEMYASDAVIKLNVSDAYVYASDGLKSALQNILHNAVVHSGKNPVEIEIKTYTEERWGVVSIADNGVGVPDEIKNRIFDEGFSTGGGSGLGLYIAKKIVEMYDGTISVRDNTPSGAVFEIRLPLARL